MRKTVEMDRDEILMGLYRGQTIVKEEFEKYFQPNGCSKSFYICSVAYGGIPQFELYAYISGDKVDYVETFKSDVDESRVRPVVTEGYLTPSDKKYAYDTFDRCFRPKAADEIDDVIDKAVEVQAEYEGYRILKRLSGGIQYSAPDGKKGKLLVKRLMQALDFSHNDISILRDAETASAFVAAFGKAPFQPLFAILQTVDATKYPDYKELDNAYRFAAFQQAVCSGDTELCKNYTDLFAVYPDKISQLCVIAAKASDNATLQFILDNTKQYEVNIEQCVRFAVEKDNETAFYALLNSEKNKERHSMQPTFCSAVYSAAHHDVREKYLKPLLQNGCFLRAEFIHEYLGKCSLDQIKDLLVWNVELDQETVNRIISEERWDIVDILESCPGKIPTTRLLLLGYLEKKQIDRFAEGLRRRFDSSSRDLLMLAYQNGQEWADLLLENGYDVNIDDRYWLHYACSKKDIKLVDYLLKHGANPALHGKSYSTVMADAFWYNINDNIEIVLEICKMLMDYGVEPFDKLSPNWSHLGFMHAFPDTFKRQICDWITDHGLINTPDSEGRRRDRHMPLYYLIDKFCYGYTDEYDDDLVMYYLEKGAIPNAKGVTYDAIFQAACIPASIAVLDKMLQCGADVNEVDSFGEPGLWRVVWRNLSIEKVKFLVEHGADVNYYKPSRVYHSGAGATTYPAESILDLAQEKCSGDIVEYLKSAGARHGKELEEEKYVSACRPQRLII